MIIDIAVNALAIASLVRQWFLVCVELIVAVLSCVVISMKLYGVELGPH